MTQFCTPLYIYCIFLFYIFIIYIYNIFLFYILIITYIVYYDIFSLFSFFFLLLSRSPFPFFSASSYTFPSFRSFSLSLPVFVRFPFYLSSHFRIFEPSVFFTVVGFFSLVVLRFLSRSSLLVRTRVSLSRPPRTNFSICPPLQLDIAVCSTRWNLGEPPARNEHQGNWWIPVAGIRHLSTCYYAIVSL